MLPSQGAANTQSHSKVLILLQLFSSASNPLTKSLDPSPAPESQIDQDQLQRHPSDSQRAPHHKQPAEELPGSTGTGACSRAGARAGPDPGPGSVCATVPAHRLAAPRLARPPPSKKSVAGESDPNADHRQAQARQLLCAASSSLPRHKQMHTCTRPRSVRR